MILKSLIEKTKRGFQSRVDDKQNKSFTDFDLYNKLNDIDKELFESI